MCYELISMGSEVISTYINTFNCLRNIGYKNIQDFIKEIPKMYHKFLFYLSSTYLYMYRYNIQ